MNKNKSNQRKQWGQYEDECLLEAISELGVNDWSSIAEYISEKHGIKERSGKKCRERWINHLKPEVTKSVWSDNEVKTLFRCHNHYGNQWTEIARFLPGRTDNSVKNYFYSTLRRKIRWYNKLRDPTERITESANEISLNPELTKIILETVDHKKPNRGEATRKSSRLRKNEVEDVVIEKLPKVIYDLSTSFETMNNSDMLTNESICFNFSRYLAGTDNQPEE